MQIPPVHHREPDTLAAERRTARRTLLNAAWATPVVLTATVAPAVAASGDDRLAITGATFRLLRSDPTDPQGSTWLFLPLVLIQNPGPSDTADLLVTMTFPASFTGRGTNNWPGFNGSPGSGWGPARFLARGTDDSFSVQYTLTRGVGLPAHDTVVLGTVPSPEVPDTAAYQLIWDAVPAATSGAVTVTVSATGYADALAALTAVR